MHYDKPCDGAALHNWQWHNSAATGTVVPHLWEKLIIKNYQGQHILWNASAKAHWEAVAASHLWAFLCPLGFWNKQHVAHNLSCSAKAVLPDYKKQMSDVVSREMPTCITNKILKIHARC